MLRHGRKKNVNHYIQAKSTSSQANACPRAHLDWNQSTYQPKMMQSATGCKVININFAKPISIHNNATNKMVGNNNRYSDPDSFHEPVMLLMNIYMQIIFKHKCSLWKLDRSYPERVLLIPLKWDLGNHSSPVPQSVQSKGNRRSTAIQNCTTVPESNKTASFFISVISFWIISRH